jgi:serine/threonine protein kinase/Tfp pilus assembly protein PilF
VSQSQSQPSEQEVYLLGVYQMLGKTLGGRYKIISHLGGGGYGQTYLAEDIHLPNHPRCVVKQLKPQTKDSWNLEIASRLFNTEAEVLYKLGSHSQIPRLFAHFEENQEFYLVQEFIEGIDLSQELATQQQMRESQVILLLQEILEVLEFVHQQLVIHRDINPRNIIRRKHDNKLVLIDFGAVKQISTRVFNGQTQGGKTVAIGTPGYMPIEQVNGNPRFGSDIYAVGIIAVQALTGLDPSRHQLPKDPKTGEIYWRNRAMVSPEIANIIDQMIISNFQNRYQAASEVLKDIKSVQISQIQPQVIIKNIGLQDPEKISNNSSDSPGISPLPSSNRNKSVKSLRIWLGLVTIGAILLLFKVLASNQSKLFEFSEKSNKPIANSSPATDSKQALIPPLASPIPEYKLSPSRANRVARYIKQGDRLIESGEYERAVTTYNNALAIKPAYEEAYWGQCYSFDNLQRYAEAIATCDKALQLNPDYYKAWWSKGYALDALKRYDEALAHYDRALKIKPDFAEAWINKGATLTSLQRYEEALAAYAQALKIKPDLPEALNNQGATLNRLQRYQEALASYDKALKLKPDYVQAWNNRGIVLMNLKQYQEAIASYDKAIRLKPDYQPAIENRKQAQQLLGQ